MSTLDDIEAVARAVVYSGGAVLRTRYRRDDADATYTAHDVKAKADEAAEEQMLPVIRRAFPGHSVFAEEAGEFAGSEPYHWIVDPLDGTNNFTAGLPTFGSAVSVLRDGEPVVAAVHQPMTDETYFSRREQGVRYNGRPVTAESTVSPDSATVAIIVGRNVPRDSELSTQATAIREGIDAEVKRVCSSWAPTVHAGLLARGRIQGLVQFHPDEEEQAATELFAAEAGAVIASEGPLFVAACDEDMMTVLWRAVSAVVDESR